MLCAATTTMQHEETRLEVTDQVATRTAVKVKKYS